MAPFDQADFPLPRPIPEGHRRLLVLAEFLPTVPRENFDMSDFWCGTAGCALGWASHIPEFRAAGYSCNENGPFLHGKPDLLGDKFFGITHSQAARLFGVHLMGKSPLQIAARIRAFVAENAQAAVQAGEART